MRGWRYRVEEDERKFSRRMAEICRNVSITRCCGTNLLKCSRFEPRAARPSQAQDLGQAQPAWPGSARGAAGGPSAGSQEARRPRSRDRSRLWPHCVCVWGLFVSVYFFFIVVKYLWHRTWYFNRFSAYSSVALSISHCFTAISHRHHLAPELFSCPQTETSSPWSPLPPAPANLRSPFCLCELGSSAWTGMVFVPFSLAYFAWPNVLSVHLCRSTCQNFFSLRLNNILCACAAHFDCSPCSGHWAGLTVRLLWMLLLRTWVREDLCSVPFSPLFWGYTQKWNCCVIW